MKYPKLIAHGIMFHRFYNERHCQGGGSISQEDFEDILHFVGLDRILDPGAWIRRLDVGRLTTEDICLTLDEALLCQFEVALPVLEKYNLRAFWFVYSSVFEGHPAKFEIYRVFSYKFFKNIDDFYEVFFARVFQSEFEAQARAIIEETDIAQYIRSYPFYSINDLHFRLVRDLVLGTQGYETIMDTIIKEHGISLAELSKNLWMSNEHIAYLSDHGHMVGLHSYSHPMMFTTLSFKKQWEEYSKNYSHITRACGKRPIAMAHPVNSYNEDTLEILRRLGIRCGFRSNMFPQCEGGQLNQSRYEIAREDHANIMRMKEEQNKDKGNNNENQ